MGAVEIACALVLALYAATHARAPRWLGEAGLLAIAGWLGEVTCIRAYGFYQYDPSGNWDRSSGRRQVSRAETATFTSVAVVPAK